MNIICKLLGHSVETLRTNQHQIPTREGCKRCGLVRSLESIPETNCVQWVYTDGRESVGVPHTLEQDIKFGELL